MVFSGRKFCGVRTYYFFELNRPFLDVVAKEYKKDKVEVVYRIHQELRMSLVNVLKCAVVQVIMVVSFFSCGFKNQLSPSLEIKEVCPIVFVFHGYKEIVLHLPFHASESNRREIRCGRREPACREIENDVFKLRIRHKYFEEDEKHEWQYEDQKSLEHGALDDLKIRSEGESKKYRRPRLIEYLPLYLSQDNGRVYQDIGFTLESGAHFLYYSHFSIVDESEQLTFIFRCKDASIPRSEIHEIYNFIIAQMQGKPW